MAAPVLKCLMKHIHTFRIHAQKLSRCAVFHIRANGVLSQKDLSCASKGIVRCFVLSAVGLTTDASATRASSIGQAGSHKLDFEPNDPRLRSHECLKNAAGLSVDSTSAVLSQTVYAVTKIEKEYVELVNVLIVLIEYQLQVLGHAAEEERIGDLIVETRHEINKVKQRKEDLRLLFSSVEKLADASAEVAFAAGAAYASTSAGERLYSAQQEVKRVQSESEEVEQRLHEAQARSVEALSQHEEQRQTALKRAEQERHSAEESLAAEKTSSDTQTSSSEQFTGDSVADDDLSEK